MTEKKVIKLSCFDNLNAHVLSKLNEWMVSLLIDEIRPENKPCAPRAIILGRQKNEEIWRVEILPRQRRMASFQRSCTRVKVVLE